MVVTVLPLLLHHPLDDAVHAHTKHVPMYQLQARLLEERKGRGDSVQQVEY